MCRFFLKILPFILSLELFAGIDKKDDNSWVVSGNNYKLELSEKGLLKSIRSGNKTLPITNGENLCTIKIDGRTHYSKDAKFLGSGIENEKLFFDYEFKDIANIRVFIAPESDYADVSARILVKKGTATGVSVFGNIVFRPDDLRKVVAHPVWPRNMGLELLPSFFKSRLDVDSDVWYRNPKDHVDESPFINMYGENCHWAQTKVPAKLTLGKDGEALLGKDAAEYISKINASADRPMSKKFADLDIIDSENGVFFGGTRFGGKGALLRMGGFFKGSWGYISEEIGKLLKRVYKSIPKNGIRKKVVVIDFNLDGSESRVRSICWQFISFQFVVPQNPIFFTAKNQEELAQAMKDPTVLMIVNPYEEYCPTTKDKSLTEFVGDIKNFVKNGGYWLETGGNPFIFEVEKKEYLSAPSGFVADFTHFDMKGFDFAIYSVQPIHGKDFYKDIPFTQVFVGASGTANGGVIGRSFNTWIPSNKESLVPTTRIRFGKNMLMSAKSFCKDNKIRLKLSEKVKPEFLEKFKNAPIIRIDGGSVQWARQWFEKMPVPAIIHCSHYVYGTFDEQYPDILPATKKWAASDEDFKSYLRRIREKGSMFMPYTNNTWWCENPKGPTFKKYGYDALLRNQKGELSPEFYGHHTGYTACMWHPIIRKVDAEIFAKFKTEYPADIIFQDQIGSRSHNRLDFNKANPQPPNSYLDGIIYSAMENSKTFPLSTEDFFSPLFDYEIQTCGFNFGVFHPRRKTNYWNLNWRYVWETWPKDSFRLCNILGALGQERISIAHQNLDADIYNQRQLSMSVAYGIHLIIGGGGHGAPGFTDEYIEWIHWVHAVHQAISYHYIGVEMKKFKHRWADLKSSDGDCTISAVYGNVDIFANATTKSRKRGRYLLAPDGFIAETPNSIAGGVLEIGDEKVEIPTWFAVKKEKTGLDVKIYGIPKSEVIVPVEEEISELRYGDKSIKFVQKNSVLRFILPDSKNPYMTTFKLNALVK